MHHQPDGAAFDIVLLLHVACVVVGLVTTATAAATATRLRRLLGSPLPLPEPLRRYFRPGVNWAGRTVYGIPVFGFALDRHEPGCLCARPGLGLGGLASSAASPSSARGCCGRPSGGCRSPWRRTTPTLDVRGIPGRGCRSMSRAAVAALVLLIAGTVLMVAQP